MDSVVNVNQHNEKAWDISVESNNRFTKGLSVDEIKLAKALNLPLHLTPKTPIPKSWYKNIENKNILVLAGAGGRQAPLLALAGAKVTVVDISKNQLEVDKKICKSLNIDMNFIHKSADDLQNLQNLQRNSFDMIINPLSNCFFKNLNPVWKNCFNLLKEGGELIYAFNNPMAYLFDFEKANRGEFIMKYHSPYSDLKSLNEEEKKKYLSKEGPLEFGHSLTDQIGLLLKYGFVLTDFFEDYWDYDDPLNHYFPQFINIRAKKIIL